MKSRRGRKDRHEWEERVRYILRYLDDPIMLQRSPVARSAGVEKRALQIYLNRLVSRGRALRDLVDEWFVEVESSIGEFGSLGRFREFVALTRRGKGTVEASEELGLSVGYVSRRYKKLLVELLVERIAGISQ